jgi:hypothetical protein
MTNARLIPSFRDPASTASWALFNRAIGFPGLRFDGNTQSDSPASADEPNKAPTPGSCARAVRAIGLFDVLSTTAWMDSPRKAQAARESTNNSRQPAKIATPAGLPVKNSAPPAAVHSVERTWTALQEFERAEIALLHKAGRLAIAWLGLGSVVVYIPIQEPTGMPATRMNSSQHQSKLQWSIGLKSVGQVIFPSFPPSPGQLPFGLEVK